MAHGRDVEGGGLSVVSEGLYTGHTHHPETSGCGAGTIRACNSVAVADGA